MRIIWIRKSIERQAAYGGPSGTGTGGAFHLNVPAGIYTGTGTVGTYDLVFPQAIELYGASASGYIGSASVAAEISGRRNMPLVSNPRVVGRTATADAGPNALFAVGDTLRDPDRPAHHDEERLAHHVLDEDGAPRGDRLLLRDRGEDPQAGLREVLEERRPRERLDGGHGASPR